MSRNPIFVVLFGLLWAVGGCRGLAPTPSAPQPTIPPLTSAPEAPADESGESALGSFAHPVIAPAAFAQPVPSVPEPPLVPEEIAAPPPEEAPPPITLAELESISLGNNPSLARLAARVESLRGKWVQAGLPPNPSIGYQGQEIGGGRTAGQQGGYVQQQFITGGKLRLERATVAGEIAVAEQELAASRLRTLTDVRTAYYDLLLSQRRLDLAEELVHITETAVATSKRLRPLEITLIGLRQVEIEAGKARIAFQQARNENASAWRRLTAVLGLDLPPRRVEGAVDNVDTELTWEAAANHVLSQSPEIAVAAANLGRARAALDRANVEPIPDVTAQFSMAHSNEGRETLTGVQVGFPVPILNRNQGGIRQAEAAVVEASRNLRRVEQSLLERLAAAYRDYADARAQVGEYAGDILPKAQESLQLVNDGYRQGEATYIELLTVQRTFFQTNLGYIDALRELWRARLLIEGKLLRNSLADGS